MKRKLHTLEARTRLEELELQRREQLHERIEELDKKFWKPLWDDSWDDSRSDPIADIRSFIEAVSHEPARSRTSL